MSKTLVALVDSDNNQGVNFRSQPVRNDKYKIGTIPEGAEVNVLEQDGDWSLIEYKGRTGYAMSKYLSVIGEKDEDPLEEIPPEDTEPTEPDDGFVTVQLPADLAVALWEILDGVIGHG